MLNHHACYLTIDNTNNKYDLVLLSCQNKGSFDLTVTSVSAGDCVQLTLTPHCWLEGTSATLTWITGEPHNQATITMTVSDPLIEDNCVSLEVTGSRQAQLTYGTSYFYASAGDTSGGGPMQRDAVPARRHPVRANYTIVQNALADQPSQWSLQGIERVVLYMLENRSLDHLLGQIYTENSLPSCVWPSKSSPQYNGVGAIPTFSNSYNGSKVIAKPVAHKRDDIPTPDPGEQWEHVNCQIYPDGVEAPASMGGFLKDYTQLHRHDSPQQIMEFYTPQHVRVISSLATKYAVSDAWFCSVPSQTYANRAFSLTGTSDGLVNNASLGIPPFYANTIFNIMSNCGFQDWALFSDNEWPPVAHCYPSFTTYQFKALGELVGDNSNPQRVFSWGDFLVQAASGTLPAFSYVEPKFHILGDSGCDYHPPANLCNGERALSELYAALTSNEKAWAHTLLIVIFDEHGGTFDHVPPSSTIPPDQMSASPQDFTFDRLGVRVPAILISPHIKGGTVFRSPTATPFDHTSLLKTILGWQGIDVSGGVAGARAAAAPDFSGVVSTAALQTSPAVIPEPLPCKPKAPERPLSGLEGALASFWAYKITGGKRNSAEHMALATRIASAKTVAEMENIITSAVEKERSAGA